MLVNLIYILLFIILLFVALPPLMKAFGYDKEESDEPQPQNITIVSRPDRRHGYGRLGYGRHGYHGPGFNRGWPGVNRISHWKPGMMGRNWGYGRRW